jgi:hypothetical protein
MYALLAPWSFHIGGRWTPGIWRGYGKLRTASGDEYPLSVEFYPSFKGASRLRRNGQRSSSALRGMGWLCTSQGVVQRLTLSGDIYGAYLHTEGSHIGFRLNVPLVFDVGQKRGGYFDLYGGWQGQDLVMQDDGSWEGAFKKGSYNHRATVTLSWGSSSDFKALCAASPIRK